MAKKVKLVKIIVIVDGRTKVVQYMTKEKLEALLTDTKPVGEFLTAIVEMADA